MRCLGRTRTLKRCNREARILFCYQHKRQPWIFIFIVIPTIIAAFSALFLDLPNILDKIFNSQAAITYAFPKLDGNLKEFDKTTTFLSKSSERIKASSKSPLSPDVRCPCGGNPGQDGCQNHRNQSNPLSSA